jgi:hypothetical protein
MKKKISKFIYWTPRTLSILFLLFLAMFSLDEFGNGYGFWGTILGLFMHNIPVFILAIVLWISWKREIVGGITFILAGLLYIFVTLGRNQFQKYTLAWSLIIAGPAFLIGILFLINWYKKKKH